MAAWTTAGLVPLSAPVAAGGSIVVYARRGTQLVLVGLDPATGQIRWEQKAAAGVEPGGTMSPTVSDSRVAYLRSDPANPLRSTIVVADGATGTDLLRTAPGFYYSGFGTCTGPETGGWVKGGLCGWKRSADHGQWSAERIQLNLKTANISAPAATDDSTTGIAGLQEQSLDHDRWLSATRQGVQRWAHPLADYLGRAGTLGPLHFRQVDRVAVVTAFVAQPSAVTPTSTVYDIDLRTGIITFALDLDTGKLLWKTAGASADCLDDTKLSVRCHYSGHATLTVAGNGAATVAPVGLGVTLEHFDPRSGRISWSAALGSVPGLVALPGDVTVDARPAALAAGAGRRMLALGPSTPRVVDLSTGVVGPPTPGEVFWCPVVGSGSPTPVRAGGTVQPCDAGGHAVAASGASVPASVGAAIKVGGQVVRAVSTATAVTGYVLLPHDPSATSAATSAAGARTPIVVGLARTTLTQAWTNSDLLPVSAPVVVGGTAVYYGTIDRLLYLVGLDPQTGRQRWRVPASMAFLEKDHELSVRTFGDQVLYYESSGTNLSAFLDALDPATGKSLRLTQAQEWDKQPSPCSDSVIEVCTQARSGLTGPDDAESAFAIDVAHGTTRSYLDDSGGPVGWQRLFASLYQQGTGETGAIATFNGSSKIWQKSLTDLFGPGTSNVYWQRVRWTDTDFELTVLRNLSKDGSGHWRPVSLASQVETVVFSRATGQVRWRSPGLALGCFSQLSYSSSGPADPATEIACRYTGTASDAGNDGNFSRSDNVDVTIQRVDPSTGAPSWSRDLGRVAELDTPADNAPLAWAAAGVLALHTGSGVQVIDLGTGAVRPAATTDVFWCARDTTFEQDQTYWLDGQPVTARTGSGVVEACNRAGQVATGTPSALGPGTVTAGQTELVATPEGVVGFRWTG